MIDIPPFGRKQPRQSSLRILYHPTKKPPSIMDSGPTISNLFNLQRYSDLSTSLDPLDPYANVWCIS
jgi:hypothetical protein